MRYGQPKPIRGGRPGDAGYLALEADPDWVCQAKIDGWRAVWDRGRLWTRSGNPIAAPSSALSGLPLGIVVEGEWERREGVFWAFDLPDHPGTLAQRWDALQGLVRPSESVRLIPAEIAWADVESNGWEGVVWKHRRSRYPSGSKAMEWIKYRAAWL